MIALAKLAFDLALPTEEAGSINLLAPAREMVWIRRLFEKAVLGFSRVELEPLGWGVRGGSPMDWQVASASPGLSAILPRMEMDVVLDPPEGERVIVDTKFTSLLTCGRFREVSLKSGYLYQMYAYLRSQEGTEPRWADAAGLFLHPAIDERVREQAVIQNHLISFATIDLAGASTAVRTELREILIAGYRRWENTT
jgi:5-methylcytosine-specific restriction enzyme subunit McrC